MIFFAEKNSSLLSIQRTCLNCARGCISSQLQNNDVLLTNYEITNRLGSDDIWSEKTSSVFCHLNNIHFVHRHSNGDYVICYQTVIKHTNCYILLSTMTTEQHIDLFF